MHFYRHIGGYKTTKHQINGENKMAQIMNDDDLTELVRFICDIGRYESTEYDLDELIYNKYQIDFNIFTDIANDLIQLTPKIKLPITDTVCHAFLDEDKSFIIAKVEA